MTVSIVVGILLGVVASVTYRFFKRETKPTLYAEVKTTTPLDVEVVESNAGTRLPFRVRCDFCFQRFEPKDMYRTELTVTTDNGSEYYSTRHCGGKSCKKDATITRLIKKVSDEITKKQSTLDENL